ncbi:E3 ubiquitin--protein ligase, partial [Salmonella enterica]
MPFHVGNGCLPATISNLRINRIAQSATPPEMSLWEKIKEFFCSTHQTEALECIWMICHPPVGTTREDVVSRFEQLRMLAYTGCEESIQSSRYGESNFCILDADSREILSVTLDDYGNYTVNCQGYHEIHRLTLETEQGEECTEYAEGASGPLRASAPPATAAPQTPAEYDAVWSEWRKAVPAEESCGRAATVQRMRACLNNGSRELNVGESGLTTLPDCLPAHITKLIIPHNNLTRLPALPPGLRLLSVSGNPLTRLPALPSGLWSLAVNNTQLTRLPVLPPGLQLLTVTDTQLTDLPALPPGLQMLLVRNNPLTSLPELPSGLQTLWVTDSRLTHLPESLIHLSSAATVNLEGNPLSERTLQALLDITSAPDYSGPTIHFNMAGASAPREARALHLATADWLTPVPEGEPAPADRWQMFGQEDNATAFSLLLDRLSETENFKKDAGFKAQISSWLTELAEDEELRARTFVMATEATSSCEDRVTFFLHQMRNVQLVHNAEKGEYDDNLAALVA